MGRGEEIKTMKQFLVVFAMIFYISSLSAQTQTAYCDIYARGGGQNLKITIMYNDEIIPLGRSNMGNILNLLSADGWVLDREVVIPRHDWHSFFTRHKLHLIMKKEYREDEQPFGLISSFASVLENQEDELIPSFEETPVLIRTMEVCDMIEYNGVPCFVVDKGEHHAILAAKATKEGTWNEAVEYCKSLGAGWKLPTENEGYTIPSTSNFWIADDSDDTIAKYFQRNRRCAYKTSKDRVLLIQPIAVVAVEDLQ